MEGEKVTRKKTERQESKKRDSGGEYKTCVFVKVKPWRNMKEQRKSMTTAKIEKM